MFSIQGVVLTKWGKGLMNCRRSLIFAVIGVLLSSVAVYADMAPMSRFNNEHQKDVSACLPSDTPSTNQSGQYSRSILDDFGLGTIELEADAKIETEPPVQTQRTIELTGGPSSVSLCLYALMSLSLCSAPHWIRKLHFGHLPEWYHDGGPFQIGHSFAATPESLCTLQVYYFNPSSHLAEDFLPQYRQRDVISLWRESQFTPDAIASRGPPNMS